MLLIHPGTSLEPALARAGFSREELRARLRAYGIASPADVEAAVLDPSGAIQLFCDRPIVGALPPSAAPEGPSRGPDGHPAR